MRSNNKSSAAPPPHADGLLVGVDIGGTKTAVVVCADLPKVLWREEFQTLPENGPTHALEQIVRLIDRGVASVGGGVRAIGVSCGGPLDRVSGVIQSPPNLPTWDNVPIKSYLE